MPDATRLPPTPPADHGPDLAGRGLVLVDGYCLLCQGSVKFLLPRDSRGRLCFASLQSAAAADALRSAGVAGVAAAGKVGAVGGGSEAGSVGAVGGGSEAGSVGAVGGSGKAGSVAEAGSVAGVGARHASDTVLFLHGGRVYTRSDAALRILGELDAPWSALRVLLVIPRPIRDWVYDLIAQRRYRWFGRSETCMVPPVDHGDRFLGGMHYPETGPNP